MPLALATSREVLATEWADGQPVHADLEVIADVAGRIGQAETAARLYGAARQALGEAAFGEAFVARRRLTPDQAVAEAMAFPIESSAEPVPNLPPRAVEILPLLAAGMSNTEIAEALCLSVRTVERHVARLFAILGAHSRSARLSRRAVCRCRCPTTATIPP